MPIPMTLGETPLGGGTGLVDEEEMNERISKDARGMGQALLALYSKVVLIGE